MTPQEDSSVDYLVLIESLVAELILLCIQFTYPFRKFSDDFFCQQKHTNELKACLLQMLKHSFACYFNKTSITCVECCREDKGRQGAGVRQEPAWARRYSKNRPVHKNIFYSLLRLKRSRATGVPGSTSHPPPLQRNFDCTKHFIIIAKTSPEVRLSKIKSGARSWE